MTCGFPTRRSRRALGVLLLLGTGAALAPWRSVEPAEEALFAAPAPAQVVRVRDERGLERVHELDALPPRVTGILTRVGLEPSLLEPGDEVSLSRRDRRWCVQLGRMPADEALLFGVPVNLNQANERELQVLPAVGPARAAAIVAARPYRSVGDVVRARGVGPRTVARWKGLVTTKRRRSRNAFACEPE